MTSTKSLPRSTASTDGLAGCKFRKAKTIAERLGVCSRTIFRWADECKIAPHKIDARVVLFDEAEVMRLIQLARIGYVSRGDKVGRETGMSSVTFFQKA